MYRNGQVKVLRNCAFISWFLQIIAREVSTQERRSGTAEVVVTIIDMNDNTPEFQPGTPTHTSVYENATINTHIVTLTVSGYQRWTKSHCILYTFLFISLWIYYKQNCNFTECIKGQNKLLKIYCNFLLWIILNLCFTFCRPLTRIVKKMEGLHTTFVDQTCRLMFLFHE